MWTPMYRARYIQIEASSKCCFCKSEENTLNLRYQRKQTALAQGKILTPVEEVSHTAGGSTGQPGLFSKLLQISSKSWTQ